MFLLQTVCCVYLFLFIFCEIINHTYFLNVNLIFNELIGSFRTEILPIQLILFCGRVKTNLYFRIYIYTAEPQYKWHSINCMVAWFFLRHLYCGTLQLEPYSCSISRSINHAIYTVAAFILRRALAVGFCTAASASYRSSAAKKRFIVHSLFCLVG